MNVVHPAEENRWSYATPTLGKAQFQFCLNVNSIVHITLAHLQNTPQLECFQPWKQYLFFVLPTPIPFRSNMLDLDEFDRSVASLV